MEGAHHRQFTNIEQFIDRLKTLFGIERGDIFDSYAELKHFKLCVKNRENVVDYIDSSRIV